LESRKKQRHCPTDLPRWGVRRVAWGALHPRLAPQSPRPVIRGVNYLR